MGKNQGPQNSALIQKFAGHKRICRIRVSSGAPARAQSQEISEFSQQDVTPGLHPVSEVGSISAHLGNVVYVAGHKPGPRSAARSLAW